jgi:hypothetical protein
MKKIIILTLNILILFVFTCRSYSSENPAPIKKIFSIEEIKALADVYVNNNLALKNPAIVDVDGDGNFDILIFNAGNVEYYRNTGTLEKPFFVPENMHYDKYSTAFFFDGNLPYPMFFADKNGDGKPDMFVVKDRIYNNHIKNTEYKILYSENVLDLDTGTLVTIILILVIVLLLLLILHK